MSAAFQLVYAACVSQSAFAFVLLWTRRRNVTPSRILAAAVFVVGVSGLYTLYLRSGWYLADPRWLFAIDTLPALYGPLFYLYTRALLRRDVRASRAWPHFVPFVVYTLAELPRLLSPGAAKLALATGGKVASASLWLEALDGGVELQGLAYLIACLGVVRSHRAALEQAFSNLERRQVRWLGRLLGALLVLWVGSMAARATGLPVLIYVHAALTIVISAIAYRNAVEPELFEVALAETRPDTPAASHPPAPSSAPPAPPLEPSSAAPARPPEPSSAVPARLPSSALPATSTAPSSALPTTPLDPSSALPATPLDHSSALPATSPDQPPAPAARAPVQPPSVEPVASPDVAPAARYQKARLKDEQALGIAERLRAFFERERPYLDPDFALATLGERLGESPHHLSQVLNERFGQSFYDYVNSCRVEELKRRLLDPRFASEKVLAIGLDCGFSSKSALNANFKKWTGMTPTEFRQRGARAASRGSGGEADARG